MGTDAACDATPMPNFSDDFTDDELAWAVFGENGVGLMAKGVVDSGLEFTPTMTGSDWGYAQTIARFDVTGLRVLARIDEVNKPIDELRDYFGLLDGTNTEDMVFVLEQGLITTPFGSAAYDPEEMIWWQVRSDGVLVHFETSIDGISWDELSAGDPGDFDVLDAFFEVGIEMETSPDSSPGTFRIDDLNIPPGSCGR